MTINIDKKDLVNWQNKLIEKMSEQDALIKHCVDIIAARVYRAAVKNTPVDTGWLRKGWTLGAIKKIPNGYQVKITNARDYATYVEYGHRLVVKGVTVGWVDGFFMLTIAEEEVRERMDRIIELEIKKFLREILK